jgi:hypothetical protein
MAVLARRPLHSDDAIPCLTSGISYISKKILLSINKKFHLTLYSRGLARETASTGPENFSCPRHFFIDFQLVGATRSAAPEKAELRRAPHSTMAML